MLRLVALFLCLGLVSPGPCHADDELPPLTLFAAASLADVLDELAIQFKKTGGVRVVVALGSSSTMARQIQAGAPADIFASAHPLWLDYLRDFDLLDVATVQPAATELVLISAADGAVAASATTFPEQLMALLGEDGYLAVGDPAHVPAGMYARQVLEAAGLWRQVEQRLVRAESVRSALALVSRGEAAAGLVYRTDAQHGGVRLVAVVPGDRLPPVHYQFAGVRGASHPDTMRFLEFLSSSTGQAIFRQHGFRVAAK